jgi:hypothetical protein
MNDPLLSRVWRTLQDEGLGSFWLKSLDALGYRRLYLLRRPLAEPILDSPTMLPVAIRWLTLEEVQDCCAAWALPRRSVWHGCGTCVTRPVWTRSC